LTYNNEDCENLRQLTSRLRDISANGTHLSDVRFSEIEGGSLTENASSIIERFKGLLRSAHGIYEQKKIRLKKTQRNARGLNNNDKNQYTKSAGSKVNREVNVRRGRICPLHPGKALRPIETQASLTITDLVFTPRGVKKMVTRYLGKKGYCSTCKMVFNPPAIRKFRRGQRYGRGLQAWVTYHRMALRLPFDKISQLLEDTFGERIGAGQVYNLVGQLSHYYVHTENLLLKRILSSPVIYADETLINIKGDSQYVWVITDGAHVVFRQTESREASIIHEMLDGYSGVLPESVTLFG
jgi:transposase